MCDSEVVFCESCVEKVGVAGSDWLELIGDWITGW